MEPKFRNKYPYERHPEENIDPEEGNEKMEAETGMGAGGGILHRMGKESLAEGMASGLGGRSYKEVAK